MARPTKQDIDVPRQLARTVLEFLRHGIRDDRPAETMQTLANSVILLAEEVDRLQAFKDYVHRRLDGMQVPRFESFECRVGKRLDLVAYRMEDPTL